MSDRRIWTDVVTRAIIALHGMTPEECFADYGLHVRGRTLFSHRTAMPTDDVALPDITTTGVSPSMGQPEGPLAIFARYALTPTVRLHGLRQAWPSITIDGTLPDTMLNAFDEGMPVNEVADFSANPALAELSGAVITEITPGDRNLADGTFVPTTRFVVDPIWRLVTVRDAREPAPRG